MNKIPLNIQSSRVFQKMWKYISSYPLPFLNKS